MFKLAINRGRIAQGFYPQNSRTMIWVDHNGVADFLGRPGLPTGFEPISGEFLEEAQKLEAKRIYIQRSWALGDTLMAIPVLREIKKLGWDCYLRASDQYASIMPYLDIPFQSMKKNTTIGDVGLVADWMLEQDHTDEERGALHRVHIYAKAAGVKMPPASEIDWSMDISKLPEIPALVGEKYIVLQTQGANTRKCLPLQALEKIAVRLNAAGIKVCHVGPPEEKIASSIPVKHFASKLSLPQLFSLIAGAECAVVMDSAPLWITHFTTTPVIAMLGPTAWQQRLSLHPLAPEGVRAIQLEQRIGCKPCREKAEACAGRYDCLVKVDTEALAKTVLECVEEFIR